MKRVLFVHTGGTLGMAPCPDGGPLRPGPLDPDLLKRVPELADIADVELHVLMSQDSSNLRPSDWEHIGAHISQHLPHFDGVVVLHGTDTLAWTATALSFMLRDLDRPVVLTGSQRPLQQVPTDARNNIVHACLFATMQIPEVAILFGSQLFRGNRTTKVAVSNYRAFASPNLPPLAEVGVDVHLSPHIRRGGGLTTFRPGFCEQVVHLPLIPGMRGEVLDALRGAGVQGLVLSAFGSGNLPLDGGLPEAVQRAVHAGVPVVVTTQCLQGPAQLGLYEGGEAARGAGALAGGDMTPEAAVVKLMYLLGQSLKGEALRRAWGRSLAGEITTPEEEFEPVDLSSILG